MAKSLLLILFVSSSAVSMQLSVPVPSESERTDIAEQIVVCSGYRRNTVHYNALYFAFGQMAKTPNLSLEEGADVALSNVPIERVKQVWLSYKKNDDNNSQKSTEAQELIASALTLLLANKDTEISSHVRQKYIIAIIGTCTTITSTLLAIYLKS